MGKRSSFLEKEKLFLSKQLVLRLGTTSRKNVPHVVPLCFIFYNGAFYMHMKNGDSYKRIRNLKEQAIATILLDEFDPRWKLGHNDNKGLLLTGKSSIIEEGEENNMARKLLIEKYPQYKGSAIETGCPMLKVTPQRVISWGIEESSS